MPRSTMPRPARLALAATGTAALVLLPLTSASAHVSVRPDSTAAEGFSTLAFRVPNESDAAGTVRVEVTLPTDTPLTSVRSEPVAGWDAQVVRGDLPAPVDVEGTSITEAPLSVVWTAHPGTQVGPDQFQDFVLSVGPLPAEGTTLLLPVDQTYSDGEVVAWDEPTPASGEEPEHPVPTLVTTAASADGHHDSDGDDDASAAAASGTDTGGTDTAGSDTAARVLGGGGVLLGAGALMLSLTRRRPQETR